MRVNHRRHCYLGPQLRPVVNHGNSVVMYLISASDLLLNCAKQVPAATVQVTVQPCGVGQVPSADQNQCTLCPSSSYSFDPTVDDCKTCPTGATCIGGATLVPQQQYWHSAPDSDHIVTCPNNNACAGNTKALLTCQNLTYQASLVDNQVGFGLHCLLRV